MNIVELIKECPKYTKLYTITHGEVLFDHVEGNCIVVITETSNGFTKYLKLDELGRLSEHGQTVLFPSTSGTWDEFDILNTHGKYLTSLYASLAAGTSLNISDNIAAHENHIECYRLATDSEKQRMIKALKKSENPKAKEYLKRFFGIKEEPKYDFKPFDKVLVRKEGNKKWNISLFAREIVDDYNGLPYKYECSNGTLWDYCIHFEGNECLLGTTENPEK